MNSQPRVKKHPGTHPVVACKWSVFLALAGSLWFFAVDAKAVEITEWRFQTSLYTKHWDPEPYHVNQQHLLDIQAQTSSSWFYGFAYFDNSFGQASQYLYAGYGWNLFGREWAYFRLTGGLLHGYKEPSENKIPLNELGIAPVLVPSVGFRYKRVFSEILIGGNSAVTVTAGFSFGHKKE